MLKIQNLAAGGLIFILLSAGSWMIWTMTPQFVRRTVLWDYRILLSVVVIFLFLTLAEAVVSRVWARLFPDPH
ncbi:MAG: hypothetical protein ABJN26_06985 [Stappiaceae bacterium]